MEDNLRAQSIVNSPDSYRRADYEIEDVELRSIDEQVGTQTLMLTTERAASGRLRQADAVRVAARASGKPRPGRKK